MYKKEVLIGKYKIRIQSSVANDGFVWQLHEREGNRCIAQAWDVVQSVKDAENAAKKAIPEE